MRTEQEILNEYKEKIKEFYIDEDVNKYITNIKKMIKEKIKCFKPCYRDGSLVHVSIYGGFWDYYEPLEEWYTRVYKNFVDDINTYLKDSESKKVNELLEQEFTLDKLRQISAKEENISYERDKFKERLLDEYSLIPNKDMDKILDDYMCCCGGDEEDHDYINFENDCIIHPFHLCYVTRRCTIKLICNIVTYCNSIGICS